MSHLTYSKTLDCMTQVIIAAELSTRRENRGMGRKHPHLLEHAAEMMCTDNANMRIIDAVEEAQTIAQAVWYDLMKPKVVAMLNELCADQRYVDKMLNKYFSDEGITYEKGR